MVDEIIEDLQIELTITDENFNLDLLQLKVKSAYQDVKQVRNYPDYYTEEMIDSDMRKFYSNIVNIARHDYYKVGADYENSHSENGVSRSYQDRDKLFAGVIPLSRRN